MDDGQNQRIGKIQLIVAMSIFGSIGLFVRNIPWTSGQISLGRGIVATLFLFVFGFFIQKSISWGNIKPKLKWLIVVGIIVGLNWILLFQAYKYTTISIATICYYFSPVAIMFLSPFFLKERLTVVKILCVFIALGGMILIVGAEGAGGASLIGIIYGLSAAFFYTMGVLINKSLDTISGMEKSFVEIAVAAIFLVPYVLITDGIHIAEITLQAIIIVLILGIVHTGITYVLFFSALQRLKAQTVAVLSYIDPVTAICLSWVFLNESMTLAQVTGGVLVLGATLINEMYERKCAKRDA